jgi:hypothetical protein
MAARPTRKRTGPLTAREKDEIRALKAKGLSVRSIAALVGRGKTVVGDLLGEHVGEPTFAPDESPTSPGTSAPVELQATPQPHVAEVETLAIVALDRLGQSLSILDRCNEAVLAADDFTRVASLQRTIKDVVLAVAKITPPAPVDVNVAPDYVKIADAVVEKTIGRLRRMAAAAKAAP